MKSVRTDYEAKIIAALPEARRNAAMKALEYSHEQWSTPFEFEAKLRGEFIQKKLASPADQQTARKELVAWINTEREKARTKNAEIVKTLKSLLEPAEAATLESFDKNREKK